MAPDANISRIYSSTNALLSCSDCLLIRIVPNRGRELRLPLEAIAFVDRTQDGIVSLFIVYMVPKGGAFLDPVSNRAALGMYRFRSITSVCGRWNGTSSQEEKIWRSKQRKALL